MTARFCASCINERPDLRMVVHDGKLVVLCGPCRGEEPRRAPVRDFARGYECPTDKPMSIAEIRRAVDRFAENVGLPAMELERGPSCAPAQDGEVLYRVPMRLKRKWIDRDQAADVIADKPWIDQARYLGTSNGYHVFAYRRAA